MTKIIVLDNLAQEGLDLLDAARTWNTKSGPG